MKRRLIYPQHRCYPSEFISDLDLTSQVEPNLHDILVAYQHGEDVSDYIRMPASKATADQQFTNRVAKVDPLTEIPEYINKEVKKANAAVDADRKKRTKSVETTSDTQKSPDSPTQQTE